MGLDGQRPGALAMSLAEALAALDAVSRATGDVADADVPRLVGAIDLPMSAGKAPALRTVMVRCAAVKTGEATALRSPAMLVGSVSSTQTRM